MSRPAREQRRRPRTHVRHAAWIRNGAGAERVPCVLWDHSEGGARIAAACANKLPRVFTLLRSGQPDRRCRIVWRNGAMMGVRFLEASEDGDETAGAQDRQRQYWETDGAGPNGMTLTALGWHPEAAEDSAGANAFLTSTVAAGFLIVLVALTIMFYFAGRESGAGAAWAQRICQEAHGLCRHPEFSGGASMLMAVVYLAIKGMELRD